MDISDIISPDFTEFDVDTPLSKVAGAFENQELDAVVVRDGEEYRGMVSRRQLADSTNQPDAKVGTQVQHVPTVERTEDVREVARLMIGSDAKSLPVLNEGRVVGTVTVDAVLETVRPFLDAATVEEAYTEELVSVGPDATIGKALNAFREGRIAHLPIVEDDALVGIVSLYDVVDFTTRGGQRSQGGSAGSFGGRGGGGGDRSGGYGAREGDSDRMLDLPVRNLMSESVETVHRDATLDDVVDTMFEHGISSLVVTDADTPVGIVTKTDVIAALTWERPEHNTIQVSGVELLGTMSEEDVASLVEDVTSKYGDMSVIKANVELQEHKEQVRGVPLILARIRLVTDRGYFTADGEGYGATQALRLAANALERQVLKGKTYGESKKRPDEVSPQHIYGWWLGG